MGGHKTISGSSYPTPAAPVPPPVADYHVSGTLTPDATCNYFLAGIYNGQPYYRRADGAWFIWWYTSANYWIISPELGETPITGYWYKAPTITGDYTPVPAAVGIATVSAGPH